MRNHLLQSPQLMPATEMHEQRRFDYMSAVAMEKETVAIDVVALKLLHGDFIWVVLAVKAWTSMIAQKIILALLNYGYLKHFTITSTGNYTLVVDFIKKAQKQRLQLNIHFELESIWTYF